MSDAHALPNNLYNISGLVAFRAELAGTIQTYEERLNECVTRVETIDAAIKLIDPTYDLSSIKPKRPRASRHAVGATIFILDTLRQAGQPLNVRDLGLKLVEARGHPADDDALVGKAVIQVQGALQSLRKQGTVESFKEGVGPQLWRLTDYAHRSDGDDNDWMAETLFALHRAIVAARHYSSHKRLREALGVSAYAEAFELVMKKKGQNPAQSPAYSYVPVRLSVQMLLDDVKARTDRLFANAIFLGSLTVAFSALLAALGRLEDVSKTYTFPAHAVNAFGFAVEHPGFVLGAMVFVVVSALVLMGGDHFLSRPWRTLSERIFKGLAFLPQAANGSLFFLAALIMFSATAVIVWVILGEP